MVYVLFVGIYIALAILLVIQLLLYGIRPSKTLAWVLVIFTIPVAGMLLYFMLGRNRRKNKLFCSRNSDHISLLLKKSTPTANHITDIEYEEHKKLITLISKNSKSLPCAKNNIQLLKNGETTFKAIFRALKSAQTFIHIEYYIFEDGELADTLFLLFQQKVKEGVQIRVIYDGIGSISLSKTYIQNLKNIGVQVHSFLPIRLGKFLSSINYRNHRKIIVVDNAIAFTGGINVSDKYIKGDPNLGIWYDMHLQLEGPIVNNLQAIFAIDWHFITQKDDIFNIGYFFDYQPKGEASAQIVHSDPDSDFSATQQLFLSMITEAKNYVYITNPYIIPGETILSSLEVAALSGVDVRLLMSDISDNVIVRWCIRSYFERLLEAGVKIYLFSDGFIHSKTIVADDTVSSVGTSNMDIRSFDQNYEVNVVVYDNSFAVKLKEDFFYDCTKSSQVDYTLFKNRPLRHKLKEGAAKILSPVL